MQSKPNLTPGARGVRPSEKLKPRLKLGNAGGIVTTFSKSVSADLKLRLPPRKQLQRKSGPVSAKLTSAKAARVVHDLARNQRALESQMTVLRPQLLRQGEMLGTLLRPVPTFPASGTPNRAEQELANMRQALDQAVERGELFNVKIANRRWYPASFVQLEPSAVKTVCLLLQGIDLVSPLRRLSRLRVNS